MTFALKKITRQPTHEQFATADIETRAWIYFIVLGFYDGKEYREFKSMKSFIEFLRNPPKQLPKNIFFHFGGKFDFMFLLREVAKHKDITIENFIPRGALILSFEVVFNGEKSSRYTMRDSSSLLPFKLKTLTDSFDVSVKKGEWDHTKTKRYTKELGEYLKSDTIGLYQVIEKFSEQPIIKSSGLAYTIAGQAMRVFRSQFLDAEIMPHQDLKIKSRISEEELCRKSYFGGRTEIFRPLCREKIYEYDVNSLYPYIMRENIFPISGGLRTKTFKKEYLGIYHCEVECPQDLNIPILGIVSKNKFIFPVGKFEGVFTSAELNYSLSLGYKIKIIEGFYFVESKNIFAEYIKFFYNQRLNSKSESVENITAKLLMNSLYGRFGLNPLKEKISFELKKGVTPTYEVKTANFTTEIFKEETELETFHKVAIASFVTSYARIYMHQKYFLPLGQDLYYTDTDSIFTTKKLETSKDLGGIKLVQEYSEGAVFILPKTYIAKNKDFKKTVMKGFPKDKIKDFTIDDFISCLDGELKKIKVKIAPKFATFKQAIKNKKFLTMTKESSKELRSSYTKRIIYKKSGEYYSRPITIKGEENENS